MKYKNLIIIGTSHIAAQSIKEVEEIIKKEKPEIIALELDKKRFFALIHKQKRKISLKDIRRIGIKGFIFNMLGAWIEKKLGKIVNVKPGAEMITAIKLAQKNKIKIALIDQDIEITLQRLSLFLTWKEKCNFIIDIIKSIIFPKSELKQIGIKRLDLTKVPSKKLIRKLIKKVKERYPNIYKVLIEERNQIIAHNLSNIISKNPEKKVIAIIGAGHEEEIIKLIKTPKLNYSFQI